MLIGSDHLGYALKEDLKEHLQQEIGRASCRERVSDYV